MATRSASSSIAMALAGKTASVEIPKPRDSGFASGRDSFVAVQTRHHRHGQPAMLPTPPHSVSPNIYSNGFKILQSSLPESSPYASSLHADSDIDLQDAVDRAKSQDKDHHTPLVAENLSSLAGSDPISPRMLATNHLPDILLNHGPLAIRHIIGYLTASVPGFSRIPPAKARRLVVGALEGRGNGNGEGAGVDGDVEFEKVGWGRWEARRRNQPPRHPTSSGGDNPASPPGSAPSSYYHERIQLPATAPGRKIRDGSGQYGSSMAGDSAVFSHSDFDYADHEADKMSLDGDGDDRASSYCSSSEAPEDEIPIDGDWDEADLTDEEDWAQIGAAALRARSYPSAPEGGSFTNINDSMNHKYGRHHYTSYTKGSRGRNRGGGPSYSALTKSSPCGIPIQPIDFSLLDGVGGGVEERAAIEALLKLGSM
ncbi:uncharacterized protein PADG_01442 [Paracoccidioides brasiliensis Pb18]|uniref:Sin3 binding protein n=2 Tax=Paracoccidioides brasiliensis TaxID=121759 RepID=C1G3C6_PARBD|nr:uncharacterized protein PADG_01442 [Paracoccidioides brasiliensis Pb18]EEH45292.1 hypothetical protein PADG_01442 [Paracoccidioides brasiliensis Pb18]